MMQIDMHYYGTYALARSAGLKPEAAKRIALASQFVDDAAQKDECHFADGACVVLEATAHHSADIHNIEPHDQRNVWVPFHFLPGNEGGSYAERLVCRKDSDIAREMVEHHLGFLDKPYAPELIGITAHVYADTFAHYGFSGISSMTNMVDGKSIVVEVDDPDMKTHLEQKSCSFFKEFRHILPVIRRSVLGEVVETLSGALGHGAVLTYPDQPYLKWNFSYDSGERSERFNLETFVEGSEALFGLFSRVAKAKPELAVDSGVAGFDDISNAVTTILSKPAKKADRIHAWNKAFSTSVLCEAPEGKIPGYDEGFLPGQISKVKSLNDSAAVPMHDMYRYFQAASFHRNYVLRELLPKHGLVVI